LAARALALKASSCRFFGGAVDSSDARSWPEILATSFTAEKNTAWFAFDGPLKPLIFFMNCSDAAWISSWVTGGSKLNNVLMFLHMKVLPYEPARGAYLKFVKEFDSYAAKLTPLCLALCEGEITLF
jgi:hypothetical protein